jgi:hypothetical protein
MKRNNLLTLIISLIFCFVIFEMGLRMFTPFPICQVSNWGNHKILGYTMDVNMDEIDEHGFRNNILSSIDVVALGDSHTYGFNVSSDNSWPKLLGKKLKKNVYNFGIGGYGILQYQYQYLLNKSIALNPEVILLGLYLPNDLNGICEMVSSNQYWASRAKELYIDSSVCPETLKTQDTSREVTKKKEISIRKWLNENFATISMASEYYSRFTVLKRIENGGIKNGLVINDSIIKKVIGFKRITAHKESMDMNRPYIQMAYEVLKKFLLEGKENTELNNIRFGVLLIPSQERVYYKYLMQIDYGVPNEYKELVDNEDELKENISLYLENIGISYIDVLPDMENALLKHGNIYPVRDNDHPIEIGYQIYAENAFNLYQQIIKQ